MTTIDRTLSPYVDDSAEINQLKKILKQTEEKLKETEEALLFLKLSMDSIPDIIWWVDLEDARYVAVNTAACHISGYTEEEMLKMHVYETLLGITVKMWPEAVSKVEAAEGGLLEMKLKTKDNQIIPLEAQVVHITFNNKRYGFAVLRDITGRKKTEIANLQAIISQQEALLNNIPHIAWIKDGEFRYITVNEAYARFFKHRKEELVGLTDFDIWSKESAEKFKTEDLALIEKGEKVQFEALMQDQEGNSFWSEVFITPINHDLSSKIFAGSVGIAMDITARKLMEKELQTRFATTFEQTAVGMAHITGEGKWLRFNHKYAEILGYSESELMSLTAQDITYPEDIPDDNVLIQQLLQKEIPSFSREKRYIRKDGSLVWIQLTMSAVWRDSGEHDYNIAIIEDISQRKVDEKTLLTVNQQLSLKNEALMDFVLIASHDLQEPLRKMTLFSERLKQQAAGQVDQKILFNLEKIEQSVKRMNELIEGLSQYSRLMTKPQQFSRLNLNELITDVLSDFELQIRQTDTVIEVDPLPMVPGDKAQLRQLFQNLLGNALKFCRKGVQPVIRIYQASPEDEINKLPQPSVCIVVEDNGIGFEEKYAETIFKMFERLHAGRTIAGTGIGLAICKKIVECHGGLIHAVSQPDWGSRFFITLPL